MVIPGLWKRLPEWTRDYENFPALPVLARTIWLAKHREPLAGSLEEAAAGLFGLESLPAGALLSKHYGLEPGERQALCADPVHLQADIDRLYLHPGDTLGIRQDEADRLVAEFNAHFQDEKLVLQAPAPSRWILCLPNEEQLDTLPPSRLWGEDVRPQMPHGPRARYWGGILTEIQMLFHQSEVNSARRMRGAPEINSLWLWGCGRLPERIDPGVSEVFSDDVLVKALAEQAGIRGLDEPETLDDLLDQSETGATPLVTLPLLAPAAAEDDLHAWQAGAEILERDWLAPLLDALKTKRFAAAVLHTLDGPDLELSRQPFWRGWGSPPPWARLVGGEA
ncbi:MAG: hypothetical protein P8Y64_00380 [Gammaproteobacteria bacterium]|jgi:hypothetical protein